MSQPGEVAPAKGDEPKKDEVKCYINGATVCRARRLSCSSPSWCAQAEVQDKWDFINEVANSIPEFNNYMGSCAGAGDALVAPPTPQLCFLRFRGLPHVSGVASQGELPSRGDA